MCTLSGFGLLARLEIAHVSGASNWDSAKALVLLMVWAHDLFGSVRAGQVRAVPRIFVPVELES